MKHTVRHKDYGLNCCKKVIDIENYTRGLAIKLFCTECLGHETHPKECTAIKCPLYPYRGKSQKAWGGVVVIWLRARKVVTHIKNHSYRGVVNQGNQTKDK